MFSGLSTDLSVPKTSFFVKADFFLISTLIFHGVVCFFCLAWFIVGYKNQLRHNIIRKSLFPLLLHQKLETPKQKRLLLQALAYIEEELAIKKSVDLKISVPQEAFPLDISYIKKLCCLIEPNIMCVSQQEPFFYENKCIASQEVLKTLGAFSKGSWLLEFIPIEKHWRLQHNRKTR